MVKSPEKYKWSSHQAYLGKMTLPWLETDFILSMFSPDRNRAQASFKEFVDSMIGLERNKSFHGEKNLDSRLLGDEKFVLDILDGLHEEPPTKPDLEMVLVAIETVIGTEALGFLTSAARDARSFEVRALARVGREPVLRCHLERACKVLQPRPIDHVLRRSQD